MPKTVRVYRCECGEDVYVDDDRCINCGKPTDNSLLRDEEIADIVREVLPGKEPTCEK